MPITKSQWVYALRRQQAISKLPDRLRINTAKDHIANISRLPKRASLLRKLHPSRSRKREKKKLLLMKIKKERGTRRIRLPLFLLLSAKPEPSLLPMPAKSTMVPAQLVHSNLFSFGI